MNGHRVSAVLEGITRPRTRAINQATLVNEHTVLIVPVMDGQSEILMPIHTHTAAARGTQHVEGRYTVVSAQVLNRYSAIILSLQCFRQISAPERLSWLRSRFRNVRFAIR